MKVIHGARSEEIETTEYKSCPICGAVCFADMDVCFGCLHRFDEKDDTEIRLPFNASQSSEVGEAAPSIPTTAMNQTGSNDSTTRPLASAIPITKGVNAVRTNIDSATSTANVPHPRSLAQEDDDRLTTRHVCSNKDGNQFEISISVKML